MVHTYVPQLAKIIGTLPPQAACASLGLCDAASRLTKRGAGLAQSAQYRRLLQRYGGRTAEEAEAESGGLKDGCQMCEFIVQYIKVRHRRGIAAVPLTPPLTA